MPVQAKPSESQLFGKDIFLSEDTGDIDVLSVNGFYDLKVITGRPNLRQALIIRLKTDPGDLPQDQSYGSNLNKVASEGMKQAKELAFRYVTSALNNEPRVKKVESVVIIDKARDSFELNAVISLVDTDVPLNLIFPFYIR